MACRWTLAHYKLVARRCCRHSRALTDCAWWHARMQDAEGGANVAIRYGWLPRDILRLDLLTCPAVQPSFPRQVFWTKERCEDGSEPVTGKKTPRCISLPC